jgi:hypothetical protein
MKFCLSILILSIYSCKTNNNMDTENILATPEHSLKSVSGKFILTVNEIQNGQIKYWKFSILNTNSELLYDSKILYDIRHTTYFLWDNLDNVWVYSGDIGTCFWENNESIWVKNNFRGSNLTPPDFLLKKYPKIFSR